MENLSPLLLSFCLSHLFLSAYLPPSFRMFPPLLHVALNPQVAVAPRLSHALCSALLTIRIFPLNLRNTSLKSAQQRGRLVRCSCADSLNLHVRSPQTRKQAFHLRPPQKKRGICMPSRTWARRPCEFLSSLSSSHADFLQLTYHLMLYNPQNMHNSLLFPCMMYDSLWKRLFCFRNITASLKSELIFG